MIELDILPAKDCAVDPDRLRERVEALVVDAIAADLQRRLAAYEDPATGERARLDIKGNLRDGLDFVFGASALDLVELVRERFADYAPLAGGRLTVTAAGPSADQLRLSFAGPPELVSIIERHVRESRLAGPRG